MGNSSKGAQSFYLKDRYTLDVKCQANEVIGKSQLAYSKSLMYLKLEILARSASNTSSSSGGQQHSSEEQKESSMPKSVKSIGEALMQCYSLLKLNISIGQNNFIGAEGAISIANGIKYCCNILTLSFTLSANNHIGSKGAIALGESFRFLFHLSSLTIDIKEDNIGEEGAQGLLVSLKETNNILELSLSFGDNNEIGFLGAQAIADAIHGCEKLRYLKVAIKRKNNITTKGAAAIAQKISESSHIEQLSIALTNQVQGKGYVNILEGAAACNLLTEVEFELGRESSGGFDSDAQSLIDFSKNIHKLSHLKKLTLILGSNYQQGCQGVEELAKGFQSCPCLNYLTLKICLDNFIGQEGFRILGEGIASSKLLHALFLDIDCNIPEIEYVIGLIEHLKDAPALNFVNLKVSNLRTICRQRQQLKDNMHRITQLFQYQIQ